MELVAAGKNLDLAGVGRDRKERIEKSVSQAKSDTIHGTYDQASFKPTPFLSFHADCEERLHVVAVIKSASRAPSRLTLHSENFTRKTAPSRLEFPSSRKTTHFRS